MPRNIHIHYLSNTFISGVMYKDLWGGRWCNATLHHAMLHNTLVYVTNSPLCKSLFDEYKTRPLLCTSFYQIYLQAQNDTKLYEVLF